MKGFWTRHWRSINNGDLTIKSVIFLKMYAHFRMVCCHLKALKILWFNPPFFREEDDKLPHLWWSSWENRGWKRCVLFLPGPVAVSRSWLGFEQCGVGYKGIGGTNQKYQKQSGDKQHVVKILISMVHFIPFQVAEQFRSSGHLAIQSEAKAWSTRWYTPLSWKAFAVSKRIDKVLAVYKARTGLLELSLSFCTPIWLVRPFWVRYPGSRIYPRPFTVLKLGQANPEWCLEVEQKRLPLQLYSIYLLAVVKFNFVCIRFASAGCING